MTPNTFINTYCLPNIEANVLQYTSSKFLSIKTDTNGTLFTTFESFACTTLYIDNRSNYLIEVRKMPVGTAVIIPIGTVRGFSGITNANEIGVRRVDQNNDFVVVTAEAIVI